MNTLEGFLLKKRMFLMSASLLFFCLCNLCFVEYLKAAMSGGNYEIFSDNFSVMSDEFTTGGEFTISSSGGDSFATTTEGGGMVLLGGFQAADATSLTFSLNEYEIQFDSLTTSTNPTSIITLSASSGSSGYLISMTEDGNLRSGVNDIDDVQDGAVTAGSEEYGVRTVGGGGLLSVDTAIQGTLAIASHTGTVLNQSTDLYFRVAISTSTVGGIYSHAVTLNMTANP